MKIAFVSAYQKTFIQADKKLLEKHYEVHALYLSQKSIHNILKLVKAVWQCDVVMAWFADFWAFLAVCLAKLFRKKSAVIVGGYELAIIPQLNYGGLLKKKSYFIVKTVLENANRVLFVDDSLKKEANAKLGLERKEFYTIPTSVDTEFFRPEGSKKEVILTVAGCSTTEIAVLKGLDKFADLATLIPDYKFCIVGVDSEAAQWLNNKHIKNLEIIGKLDPFKLLKYYQEAKIYCQFSMREGLPNALCEAMSCGCIPVGSNRNGIPTAIGETGIVSADRELLTLYKALKSALKMPINLAPRTRIVKKFSHKIRGQKLKQVIKDLL